MLNFCRSPTVWQSLQPFLCYSHKPSPGGVTVATKCILKTIVHLFTNCKGLKCLHLHPRGVLIISIDNFTFGKSYKDHDQALRKHASSTASAVLSDSKGNLMFQHCCLSCCTLNARSTCLLRPSSRSCTIQRHMLVASLQTMLLSTNVVPAHRAGRSLHRAPTLSHSIDVPTSTPVVAPCADLPPPWQPQLPFLLPLSAFVHSECQFWTCTLQAAMPHPCVMQRRQMKHTMAAACDWLLGRTWAALLLWSAQR